MTSRPSGPFKPIRPRVTSPDGRRFPDGAREEPDAPRTFAEVVRRSAPLADAVFGSHNRPTLSKLVGGLPKPPKIARPPALRVMKALLAPRPKPSVVKPHLNQSTLPVAKPSVKPAPGGRQLQSVAGRIGRIMPRKPR